MRLCADHGAWLHELSAVFDRAWDTAWNATDRAMLSEILGLPPFGAAVTLPGGVFDPRVKVPAVAAVAGDRPLAWIDDMLTAEAWDWAGSRLAPTLLVPIDPAIGLARADVDTLVDWVEAYTRSL